MGGLRGVRSVMEGVKEGGARKGVRGWRDVRVR